MITSNIKKIMEEKGVTIQKLTEETRLAEMTLVRARGELIAKCRLETLELIASYLGVRIKDLFSESE